MQRTLTALIVVISVTAGSLTAMGQGRGRGQDNAAVKASPSASTSTHDGFGNDERRIIVEWFHDSGNLKGLPPGLAKREQLTPGLQRQLQKNGKLPPGLEKKVEPLPAGLESRLPRLPDGRRRVIIGGNVILMDRTTSLIVDIITGIFKK